MKKLLLTATMLGVAAVAFGQGQITFQNNTATAITNSMTGQRAAVTTQVGLYGNPSASATPSSAGWVLAGGTTNLTAAGLFFGGNRTLTGFPAGTVAAFQVRAWLSGTSFPTYEAALAANPADLFAGQSVVMMINPSAPPSPPPNLVANGLQAFLITPTIPEPSSIALGLLGLGAIALFRRRK